MRIATALGLLALLSGSAAPAVSQDVTPLNHLPALRGDYFRIDSTATSRPYHIYIRYPEGYDPSASALYPTVYRPTGTACTRSSRPITCS